MKMRAIRYNMQANVVLICLLICLAGCAEDDSDGRDTPYTPIPLSEETRSCVRLSNDLGVKAFAISASNTSANCAVSPFSLNAMFSMMANGDRGIGRDEILNLFGLPVGAEGLEILNDYNKMMIKMLPIVDSRVNVYVANSFWYNDRFKPTDMFTASLENYFDADIIPHDPSGMEGMKSVNEWMRLNTAGMIPEFAKVPFSSPYSLISALAFNGKWAIPFDMGRTITQIFSNSDGTEEAVPFMHSEEKHRYNEIDGLTAVAVEYGNGNYSMIVIMPSLESSFDEWVSTLDYSIISEIVDTMVIRKVWLAMPRFAYDYRIVFGDGIFRAIGLDKVLTRGFDSIFESDVVGFDKFLHAVSIVVNEEGTQVAAATATDLSGSFIPEEVIMNINRPFVYLIQENSTGSILLIGDVKQLEKE